MEYTDFLIKQTISYMMADGSDLLFFKFLPALLI